jgi:signal transduction histidine kinase
MILTSDVHLDALGLGLGGGDAKGRRIGTDKTMAESPSNLHPLTAAELDPTVGVQRYLSLFERLSLLIGGAESGAIAERACELIAELLEVAACSLTLLNEQEDALEMLAATHIPRAEWSKIRVPVAGSFYEDVLTHRQSLLIRDREDFERLFKRKPDARYTSASCVVVPLLIQERAVGAINVAHPLTRRWFEERDRVLLQAVARLIGSALHSSRQYHEAMRLQKKLTDLFNSLHVGLIVVDADGRVSHCNQRAQELFQFSPDGRPLLSDAIQGMFYNVCCRLLSKVKAEGGWAEDGLEVKIGERRLMLKARVMRCMAELLGDYLIMIEEAGQDEEVARLRESENAKHAFLSIISHELRTPLTVIRAALSLLAPRATGQPIPTETHAQLHRLLSGNCHRLSEVVNSILYVTEIESGTLELSTKPTDVHQLIAEVLDRDRANAEQRKIQIVARLEASDPIVVLDPQRMETVLSELVHNALKFANSGSEVVVRSRRDEACLEIDVTNFGKPIDPGQRKQIFQKFYQGDQTLTRVAGGCGLGLFVVYNIVRLHGGTIELPEPEQGETTFRMRLPAVACAVATPAP